MRSINIKGDKIFIDGLETNIHSGAVHYFRIHKSEWRDRLLKLKLCGLNTVETYVSWRDIEKQDGIFDFTVQNNLKEFINLANELGLYTVLRPGPYICAEYDLGGLPYFLLKNDGINLRCNDKTYIFYVERFFGELFSHLSGCLYSDGGNIIAVQIENEYGSYGNDKEYLSRLYDLTKKYVKTEIFFTSDGAWRNMISGGTLKNTLITLNEGTYKSRFAFKSLDEFNYNGPKFIMEYWAGWFDYFGGKHAKLKPNVIKEDIKYFVDNNINFNIYMFSGGTNFALSSGANIYDKKYCPTTTSYDYVAPLSESGEITTVYKYIQESLGCSENLSKIKEKEMQECNIVFDKEESLDSVLSNIDAINSTCPMSFEKLDVVHGLVEYSTSIKGKYSLGYLTFNNIKDVAKIYLDGTLKTRFSRFKKESLFCLNQNNKNSKILISGIKDELKIRMLVYSYGRVNYGFELKDSKGFTGATFANQNIYNWQMKPLDLVNEPKIKFNNMVSNENNEAHFIQGHFDAKEGVSTYISTSGLTRGIIYINGFNIGRYDSIGPQKRLYVPSGIIKEKNRIVIFEFENRNVLELKSYKETEYK